MESEEGEQLHGRARQAFIIKQGEEGTLVAEICRKADHSQATYFNWKKKYAGLLPTEMKRLGRITFNLIQIERDPRSASRWLCCVSQLEDENGRLKKIEADLTLDREMVRL